MNMSRRNNLLEISFCLSAFSIPIAGSSSCWISYLGSFNAGSSWEDIVVCCNTPGCIVLLFTSDGNWFHEFLDLKQLLNKQITKLFNQHFRFVLFFFNLLSFHKLTKPDQGIKSETCCNYWFYYTVFHDFSNRKNRGAAEAYGKLYMFGISEKK